MGRTYIFYRCTHRIGNDSQTSMRCPGCSKINSTIKVIDLTMAEGHRCTNRCTVTIIIKGQNMMACPPQMGTDTKKIRFWGAISRTNKNSGSSLWTRNKPATDLILTILRGKSHDFSRQVQLIRAKCIIVKGARFFGAPDRLNDIESTREDNAQHHHNHTQTAEQKVFQ